MHTNTLSEIDTSQTFFGESTNESANQACLIHHKPNVVHAQRPRTLHDQKANKEADEGEVSEELCTRRRWWWVHHLVLGCSTAHRQTPHPGLWRNVSLINLKSVIA